MNTLQNTHAAHLGYVPIAEVQRGGVTESVHFGAVAVTNVQGDVLYAAGNPRMHTFARSALKPFQAAPFFAAGGVAKLGLTLPETAVLCASHNGEARHADTVASVLHKADANPTQLLCGCHMPFKFSWFDKQPPPGEQWSALHHNCSGKHAGMIAAARLFGVSVNDYIHPQHPVQEAARKALVSCTGISPGQLIAATDGCSAPTYALPLHNLAQGYARLALGHGVSQDAPKDVSSNVSSSGFSGANHEYQSALNIAFKAMTEHPEMVSGEGRNDLAFTQAGQSNGAGDWVCKIGAEGVQAIGIRSLGLGIAVKVADGNMRGLYPATIAVLEQLGVMTDARREMLKAWAEPVIKSAVGHPVGSIIPALQLQKF